MSEFMMTEANTIAPLALATGRKTMWDKEVWDRICSMAKAFSDSGLVPKHFQGKIADVIVVMAIAHDIGENPLTVLQSVHMVHGTAGFSAKWMIGRVNASRHFRGNLRFRIEDRGVKDFGGPNGKGLRDLRVTAYAFERDSGEEVVETVTMEQAVAEGWTANSKYRTMPEVMLRYRAATFFVRFNCPELLFGMRTDDELEDMSFAEPARTIEIRQPEPRTRSLSAVASIPMTPPDASAVEAPPEQVKAAKPVSATRQPTLPTTSNDGMPE